jgi:hypothetical protein
MFAAKGWLGNVGGWDRRCGVVQRRAFTRVECLHPLCKSCGVVIDVRLVCHFCAHFERSTVGTCRTTSENSRMRWKLNGIRGQDSGKQQRERERMGMRMLSGTPCPSNASSLAPSLDGDPVRAENGSDVCASGLALLCFVMQEPI